MPFSLTCPYTPCSACLNGGTSHLGCKFHQSIPKFITIPVKSTRIWFRAVLRIPVFHRLQTLAKTRPKTVQTPTEEGWRVLLRPISTKLNWLEQVSINLIPLFIDVALKHPWFDSVENTESNWNSFDSGNSWESGTKIWICKLACHPLHSLSRVVAAAFAE